MSSIARTEREPDSTDSDEQVLFLQWRDGDTSALTRLVRRFEPTVTRYFARRFAGDVRDLVQRTWLAVIEAKLRFRLECPFRCFLLATARNIALEEIRRMRRVPPAHEPVLQPIASPDPAAQLEEAESFDKLAHLLGELHPKLVEVVRMFYWEGECGRKIGIRLRIPESNVRSRLRRAKERIAEGYPEEALAWPA